MKTDDPSISCALFPPWVRATANEDPVGQANECVHKPFADATRTESLFLKASRFVRLLYTCDSTARRNSTATYATIASPNFEVRKASFDCGKRNAGVRPRACARGGLQVFGLERIGAVGELAADVCRRRVSARADHRAVLDLLDNVLLVAGIEELHARRFRGFEHTAAHGRHLGIRLAAVLVRTRAAQDEEAVVAGTPFGKGDAGHTDRRFDVGVGARILNFQTEYELAIRIHRPRIGDAHIFLRRDAPDSRGITLRAIAASALRQAIDARCER